MSPVELVALCGGVGGARLALGLHAALPSGRLACIVNTGDDFEHLGLHVSPDLDTVLYTLAGCHNPETGWGRRDETWTFMSVLEQLGGPTWFRLGDGDLALHVERTRALKAGESLTEVMARVARRLGVDTRVLPMTDGRFRTVVHTAEGALEFQEYFVGRRAEPVVHRLEFDGAESAAPTREVLEALEAPGLRAIVVCPSNPYLSIAPILAVRGLRDALRRRGVPVIGVCPLIGGRAVKGPTAKLMSELGHDASPRGIVDCYAGLLDGLVVDDVDRGWQDRCGLPVRVTRTLMSSPAHSLDLAGAVLAFAGELGLR